jgi:Zn-dependent protease/CBS domain-containing protein
MDRVAPGRRHLIKLFGIDIEFHSSWIIILVLAGFWLHSYFRTAHPHWNVGVTYAAAAATTILFFASVVLHELAHSLVARANGLPVRSIMLFVFGGVSEITREPESAGSEVRIALAGPLASIVLGLLLVGLGDLLGRNTVVGGSAWILGEVNFVLGFFNLVPGFPLDGGRVLRAVIWGANKNYLRATLWATRVGKAIAIFFIIDGIVAVFSPNGALNGIWIAFIGWFLLSAAEQTWRQVEIRAALANYTVETLTTPFYAWVRPDESVEDYFEKASEYPSLVIDGDRLAGVVATTDLVRVPRSEWPTTLVSSVMVPAEKILTTAPKAGLMQALEQMAQGNVSQLPVIESGTIRGVIRRDRVIHFLQEHLSRPAA